jgi:hypothetical protein
MSHFRFATSASLAVLLSTVAVARADEAPDVTTATSSHIAVEAGVGVAAPVDISGGPDLATDAPPLGLGSVAIDLAPSKYLAVNVGLGLGLSGLNVGGSVRLRMPGGPRWAFAPAVGLAMGDVERRYDASDGFFGSTGSDRTWSNVVTMPAELGFERKTGWGRLRFYAGYKVVLHADAPSCSAATTDCDLPPSSPLYLGMSVGYDVR